MQDSDEYEISMDLDKKNLKPTIKDSLNYNNPFKETTKRC